MATRLWTHGWDFFTPNTEVVFHCWTRAYRCTFSSPENERKNALRWVEGLLNPCTRQATPSIGYDNYEMGKTRTLAEYEEFSGVDFRGKKILNKVVA